MVKVVEAVFVSHEFCYYFPLVDVSCRKMATKWQPKWQHKKLSPLLTYISHEVIRMSEHIFRDGKTYLELFEDGVLYFDDQKTKKLVPNQSIEEFYDLVHLYVTNHASDI